MEICLKVAKSSINIYCIRHEKDYDQSIAALKFSEVLVTRYSLKSIQVTECGPFLHSYARG